MLQLGPNPSEVENKLLLPEEEIEVKNGSSINLISDDLKYTLEFLDLEPRNRTKHKHQSPNTTPKRLKTVTSPSRSDSGTSLNKGASHSGESATILAAEPTFYHTKENDYGKLVLIILS